MERGMVWVICYDVVEDKRRNQVFKALQGFGQNVQYSVFECELRARKSIASRASEVHEGHTKKMSVHEKSRP